MNKKQTGLDISSFSPTCPDRATHFCRVALKKVPSQRPIEINMVIGQIGQIKKHLHFIYTHTRKFIYR